MAGAGTLRFTVWPAYIGIALAGTTPPFSINEPHNGGYVRGQIRWEPVDDERKIVGRAVILCPPGEYTHWVYFKHPVKPQACGVIPMAHPLRFTEPLTTLEVYPIVNADMRLLAFT